MGGMPFCRLSRRLLLPCCLLLACLSLSGCVRWNFGERLREANAWHVGADTAHPVDGKLYGGRYVYAPVVEYVPRTPVVSAGLHATPAKAVHQRRSGRTVVAELEFPKGEAPRFVRALPAMPADAVAHPYTLKLPATERSFGTMAINRVKKSRRARYFAAPHDYVVDPVLSIVSTPFYWLYVGGHIIVTGGDPGWETFKRYEKASSF